MSLVYWFWITAIITCCISATPVPLSSFETISTSLKSALTQNENTFQPAIDRQKVATGTKSVPLTFETSDTDDVFGGASEIDAENIAKNREWLVKPNDELQKMLVHVEVERDGKIPTEVTPSIDPQPPVNNTNNSTSSVATTMLTSVTESVVHGSSINTSTPQTTKLIKVEETSVDEHILTVKSLNLSNVDVTDSSQIDSNDTVEIVMTDDANATEVTESSERQSKILMDFEEEAKVVNNISSRSTLQVTPFNQNSPSSDDLLSSEALFDTDEDNGGITMSAGIISVICVGIIGSLSAFSIMFVYVYRRRFLNKPQTLSEPDSSGYIDESSIRDNSDELYSLDNDSFLNSLEAMTIQNYWTDSVKHTKL